MHGIVNIAQLYKKNIQKNKKCKRTSKREERNSSKIRHLLEQRMWHGSTVTNIVKISLIKFHSVLIQQNKPQLVEMFFSFFPTVSISAEDEKK